MLFYRQPAYIPYVEPPDIRVASARSYPLMPFHRTSCILVSIYVYNAHAHYFHGTTVYMGISEGDKICVADFYAGSEFYTIRWVHLLLSIFISK